jgi:hypothetical protein
VGQELAQDASIKYVVKEQGRTNHKQTARLRQAWIIRLIGFRFNMDNHELGRNNEI